MFKEFANLVELVKNNSIIKPNKEAIVYLKNGELESKKLTYKEIELRATNIASKLQALADVDSRVILIFQSSVDFVDAFWGCIFARMIAVPITLSHKKQNFLNIISIIKDTEAKILITTSFIKNKFNELIQHENVLNNCYWIEVDKINYYENILYKEHKIDLDTIAYLQYTSGSTNNPKGVIVTHGNVLSCENTIQHAFNCREDTTVLSWLPYYHDMGLIGGILQPIYVGARCILMSPLDFLQKPLRWLTAISTYSASISGGPNFAYDLCVDVIKDEELKDINLESWLIAFNGAEPINPMTIERFSKKFKPYGFNENSFFPCYGLAEATLYVSGKTFEKKLTVNSFKAKQMEQQFAVPADLDESNTYNLVGCGVPGKNVNIKIVNPKTFEICEDGIIGEIWVSGDGVAKGYWNKEKETQDTFNAFLSTINEGPFSKNG